VSDFADWRARGFGPWLVPVIPPLVRMSPRSAVKLEDRGKAVGVEGPSGWHGLPNWRGYRANAEDHARWAAMGASVGLQSGDLRACDADVPHEAAARIVEDLALKHMGASPPRIGQAPKWARLYRADAPRPKRRVAWVLNGMRMAVELLGEGQQIVVAGQHPGTGRPYAWPDALPRFDALPVVTAALEDAFFVDLLDALDMLGAEGVKAMAGGDGERDGVDQAALLAPSPEALTAALDAFPPPGDRDTWIRMGIAIKAAGGELADWEAWSNRWEGEPEDSADLQRRWDGFRPPHAVGWPWIERMARGAGWTGSAELDFAGVALPAEDGPGRGEDGGDGPEGGAPGRAPAAWGDTFDRYVWVEDVERIGDMATRALLTKQQFSVRLPEIGPPLSSTKSAAAQFLASGRARRVVGVTYRPGGAALVREGRGWCLNLWVDDGLKPAPGPIEDLDVLPFLALAEALYPDPVLRGLVLDWLAWVAQHPGKKPAFGLVLGGHQGIGKDSLLLPLARLLGASNVRHITMQDVLGGQTWYLARTRLLVVQEVHSFARVEVADRFKPLLASLPDTVVVNVKFVPQYEVPNLVACVMMTNRVDALAIDRDDRRHFVAWSERPDPNQMDARARAALDDAFRELHAWYEAGGHARVGAWLLARDVAAFGRLTRAPWTEGKEAMRQAARSEVVEMIEEAAVDWPDLVSPADLAVRLSAGLRGAAKALSGKAVASVLRAMGAKQVTRGPVMVPPTATAGGATKLRLWALRNAEIYLPMPAAALGRRFGEMWGATQQDIDETFAPKRSSEA
jgi:hypothetical protein